MASWPSAFGMTSELGAYLDPLADKVLIVSIYVTLGITGAIPLWLVILVVSRDFMIVGGVVLSWVVGKPVADPPASGVEGQYGGPNRAGRPWCWPRGASVSMLLWPRKSSLGWLRS